MDLTIKVWASSRLPPSLEHVVALFNQFMVAGLPRPKWNIDNDPTLTACRKRATIPGSAAPRMSDSILYASLSTARRGCPSRLQASRGMLPGPSR